MSLAVALAISVMLAAPAHANEVARVPLGSEIRTLVAGPEGGAWVSIARGNGYAVGRLAPGGGFRTAATQEVLREGTVGPDGQAWFDAGHWLVRVDTAGALSIVFVAGEEIGGLATGPDGNLWTATQTGGRRLVRVSPQGATAVSPLPLRRCPPSLPAGELARASDGSVWIAGGGCDRLARVAPDGSASIVELQEGAEALAADHAGGLWFTTSPSGAVEHVDAAGRVTRHIAESSATDIAVAPDGSVWLALGTCAIARVDGDRLALHNVPLPARELVFDPAGGLWLASRAEVVHAPLDALTGSCDDRPPTVEVAPGRDGRVSLRALRSTRALTLAVGEPASVSAFVGFGSEGLVVSKTIRAAQGGTVRIPVTAARLRRLERALAAGRSLHITVSVRVTDAEANDRDRFVRRRVVR